MQFTSVIIILVSIRKHLETWKFALCANIFFSLDDSYQRRYTKYTVIVRHRRLYVNILCDNNSDIHKPENRDYYVNIPSSSGFSNHINIHTVSDKKMRYNLYRDVNVTSDDNCSIMQFIINILLNIYSAIYILILRKL